MVLWAASGHLLQLPKTKLIVIININMDPRATCQVPPAAMAETGHGIGMRSVWAANQQGQVATQGGHVLAKPSLASWTLGGKGKGGRLRGWRVNDLDRRALLGRDDDGPE